MNEYEESMIKQMENLVNAVKEDLEFKKQVLNELKIKNENEKQYYKVLKEVQDDITGKKLENEKLMNELVNELFTFQEETNNEE